MDRHIANAQTAGYVRRTTQMAEARSAGDMILYRNNLRPSGVLVTGVDRVVDDWLVEDSRTANSDAGRTSALSQWLTVGETA